MRMLLTVKMPVDTGNKAIKEGSLQNVIQDFKDRAKPEAIYFGALEGKRSMIAVFDLASPSQIPSLAEPFFTKLDATFELMPVMDADDLKTGLSLL